MILIINDGQFRIVLEVTLLDYYVQQLIITYTPRENAFSSFRIYKRTAYQRST